MRIVDNHIESAFRASQWDHILAEDWSTVPVKKVRKDEFLTTEHLNTIKKHRAEIDKLWQGMKPYNPNQMYLLDYSKRLTRFINDNEFQSYNQLTEQ